MINWARSCEQGDVTSEALPEIVVNVFSQKALLNDLAAKFEEGEGFSVATINLDHVSKIRANPAFRKAYQRQTYVTADGNPIVWLSRLSGTPLELVQGSELIEPLTELAEHYQIPIALFGSTQSALDKAAAALKKKFNTLRIVACIAPEMGFDPTGAQADVCADEIAASGARLCFLALGAPKQEIFAIHACERHPHLGFVSIGAGLDFISGDQNRAPLLVRKLALEWLWRLLNNPVRLASRYAGCFAILPSLFRYALYVRLGSSREI